MSATPKPKQQTSRWGFLSQAVASVESGLDRILADEEDASKKPPPKPTVPQENGSTSRASSDIKRSDSSSSKTNDRLQARLAQAMVKKNSSRAPTPAPPSEAASRPGTPVVVQTKDHDALELTEKDGILSTDEQSQDSMQTKDVTSGIGIPTIDITVPTTNEQFNEENEAVQKTDGDPPHTENILGDIARPSTDSARLSKDISSRQSLSEAVTDSDTALLNVQLEHEKSLTNLQDEINGYLERIDALQRNMQILTKETIQSAKQVKADSSSSISERQLAEKDEKIALLIDEGTKLTKSELQYRNTIKKLRAQAVTLTKDQEAIRLRAEKAEQSVSILEAKSSTAETELQERTKQIAGLSKSSADLENITKEKHALTVTLSDMRAQLSKAHKRAEEAESKAQTEKLDLVQRKNAELQDDLSSAKVEREIAEDKLRRELDQLRQSLTREQEQTRQMETEMLAEQAALESKLESFRLRAEEATVDGQGDSQAKLLRQVETLQSQYSAASQNWQGIEGTLVGRITSLEKERDEVVGRETDLRRKLRDALSKARNSSRDLEDTQQSLHTLQDQEADRAAETLRLTRKIEQLETETVKLRKELDDQKIRSDKEILRRLEEEKVKWMASVSSRVDSPVSSVRRGTGAGFMDSLISPLERPGSRRSSTLPFNDNSLPRINSAASMRANGTIPETPSISVPDDHDEYFANVPETPASATNADSSGRHGINDVISASTAGAGPSVQLVERMSANVRRLESEKAASKDEIVRLSSQRDEARQEVVNLMREVESRRTASTRLSDLEKEHSALSAKYQATLELLGEKSEQVDELKADIADVKQMYRQLADTMGRSS